MSSNDASRNHRGTDVQSPGATPRDAAAVKQILRYLSVRPSGSAARRAGLTLGLVIGSVLLALSGAIHLQLWSMGYRTIPTIGPLFLIQGIAGFLFASVLLLSRRLLVVVMAGGFMLATIGGLLFSVYFGLFGFKDTLAAPYAGLSLSVEGSGALLLAVVGVLLASGDNRADEERSFVDLGAPLGAVADTRPDLGDRQLLNR
jgi:hypothetical protein